MRACSLPSLYRREREYVCFNFVMKKKKIWDACERVKKENPISTRQYARLVSKWVSGIGLDEAAFGTHSLRRTKATMIYRQTGNLRAVQLLLGHSKIESTVRYLGVEVDDALEIAESVDI